MNTGALGKLLFLGTGGSMGIPVIGCDCPVCLSKDPHNKRLRSSALLTLNGKEILLDCSPDFRIQCLQYSIKALDGIIFTHSHYDHTAGIDELRVLTIRSQKPIPCLLSPDTFEDIKRRFYYVFDTKGFPSGIATSKFDIHLLEHLRGTVDFLGQKIRYTSFEQAGIRVTGFRFGKMAYISDIRHYTDDIFDDLRDLDILVISALRFLPSPMHFSIDEAVSFIKRCGAKRGWLMHMAHEVDHETGNAYLPENIRLAYDGLEIEFSLEP